MLTPGKEKEKSPPAPSHLPPHQLLLAQGLDTEKMAKSAGLYQAETLKYKNN